MISPNSFNSTGMVDQVAGKSAIVVEDDVNTANALSMSLALLGYKVSVANSLAQARSLMDGQCPELILLDVKLPDGDGLQLMEDLNCRFIVITGDTSLETAIRSLRLKAEDFLVKPVGLEDLRLAVGNTEENIAVNDEVVSDNSSAVANPGTDKKLTLSESEIPAEDSEAIVNGGVGSVSSVAQILVGKTFWEVEKHLLHATLDRLKGDKKTAAETLGISLKTLYNRLNAYNMDS